MRIVRYGLNYNNWSVDDELLEDDDLIPVGDDDFWP